MSIHEASSSVVSAEAWPRRAVVSGIALTAIGAVLIVAWDTFLTAPLFGAASWVNTPSGQAVADVVGVVTSVLHLVALPLGCALLGAGIVMAYQRRVLGSLATRDDEAGVPHQSAPAASGPTASGLTGSMPEPS